eukprot:CAMPEP_0115148954 /NCGR_PEP_ID=MMETSP0227-20121206/64175_1 /TAXON_ID=89957 /ORGANISM="Polarella glacialis, Strain CCMP 1383" /LENGTH=64 /DNA_ID=CAMNT_0002559075 /DNA_START=11 /DNA_END=202 /DNA_ORIENTATION=+
MVHSAAVSACGWGSQWPLALTTVSQMMQRAVEADTIVHNAAISAAEKGFVWARALDLLRCMRYL